MSWLIFCISSGAECTAQSTADDRTVASTDLVANCCTSSTTGAATNCCVQGGAICIGFSNHQGKYKGQVMYIHLIIA